MKRNNLIAKSLLKKRCVPPDPLARHRRKQGNSTAGGCLREGSDGEPKAHASYEETAAEKNKRPFDLAVSDYFKGNDRLSNK